MTTRALKRELIPLFKISLGCFCSSINITNTDRFNKETEHVSQHTLLTLKMVIFHFTSFLWSVTVWNSSGINRYFGVTKILLSLIVDTVYFPQGYRSVASESAD